MKKIFFIGVCLFSFQVSAQMMDLVGSAGIQGVMIRQGTQSVATGMSALKNTQLLSAIQQTAMEIKTSYLNGYQNVRQNSILNDGRFQNMRWNIGPIGRNQFYIELSGVNIEKCQYLVRSVRYVKSIEVNGQPGIKNMCTQNSTIKFIFE